MLIEFVGTLIEWRGPAPYVFVRLPEEDGRDLAEMVAEVSYGWGCIPVEARIGETQFTTSLMPRDGGYLLPVKVAVRRAEGIDVGAEAHVSVSLAPMRYA